MASSNQDAGRGVLCSVPPFVTPWSNWLADPLKKRTGGEPFRDIFPEKPAEGKETEVCLNVMPQRLVIRKSYKWPNGETIRIQFLGGSEALQAKVKQYIDQWFSIGLALTHEYVEFYGHVRIAFDRGRTTFSQVGTQCKLITDQKEPTMNFDQLTEDSTDREFGNAVLHEVGHMLGAVHEHQSPAAGIKWDRAAVNKYYSGPPNNWDQKTIESNIFDVQSAAQTQYSYFDPDSIMLYNFHHFLVTGGDYTKYNYELSKIDIRHMREMYPLPEPAQIAITPEKSVKVKLTHVASNTVLWLPFTGETWNVVLVPDLGAKGNELQTGSVITLQQEGNLLYVDQTSHVHTGPLVDPTAAYFVVSRVKGDGERRPGVPAELRVGTLHLRLREPEIILRVTVALRNKATHEPPVEARIPLKPATSGEPFWKYRMKRTHGKANVLCAMLHAGIGWLNERFLCDIRTAFSRLGSFMSVHTAFSS